MRREEAVQESAAAQEWAARAGSLVPEHALKWQGISAEKEATRWYRPQTRRRRRRESAPSQVTLVALITVLGAAALVRLANLNAVGFNSDEAVYAGQGASLAGNPLYTDYFPVFRAHPMLVQMLLSVIFREGEHDLAGRVLIAAFGVATVGVVFLLGRELYSSSVGLVGAALLAVMPYHVIVTRQVLLDGPMVFFSTLVLWWIAKYVKEGRLVWVVAAGAALGLTMLTKESSIVLVGSIYAFFALTPSVRRPVIASIVGFAVAMGLFLLHPLSVSLSGHHSSTEAYLVWQLVRRPNHSLSFYLETVPTAVGLGVLALAVWALWRARRGPAWREILLASWMLVPFVAFTLWPVKGFQYLLAGAPAVALLAARGLVDAPWAELSRKLRLRGHHAGGAARAVVLVAVLAGLLFQLWPNIGKQQGASALAGSGGIAGGREAGHWVRRHTPEGAVFLTVGPSMANLVQFYGQRRAFGLSVSPNPLKRNPSYEPIKNPDARLRQGDLQYVVWDVYSAQRSQHFSEKLLTYARRYHGSVVHREFAVHDGRRKAVVVVWAVRP